VTHQNAYVTKPAFFRAITMNAKDHAGDLYPNIQEIGDAAIFTVLYGWQIFRGLIGFIPNPR
jgi:hypothetical protein